MAKTYDTYKDSGIAWIGEIPSGWEVKRLGSFYTPRNEKVSDKDYEPLSVTMKGIVPQLETAAKTDDGDNRKLVLSGDFVINSRSDRRGACGISNYDGSVSLINIVLCPNGKMDADYYNWLFHTSMFADEYYKWGHGIVDDLWTTRWSEMKNINVVTPPLPEQQAIASFLDKKCGEIDSLIALQEEMIGELQAYKQSVITDAVTKGLDPNAKMKDSGVEWIGEIPMDWKIQRLKFICTIETGNQDTQNADPEGTYPFYVRSPIVERCNKYTFEGEGILVAGDGAGAGRVFHHAFGKYAVHQRVYRLANIKNIESNFLFYFLSSLFCREMDRGSAQSTVPSVRLPMLQNFKICIPTDREQNRIVKYIGNKCKQIDTLVSLKQEKIDELKDYKKSVIYEYVTGKKRV